MGDSATMTAAVAARDAIVAAYRRNTPASAALHARARRALVGGTTGNLRHFAPYPLYFTTGRGSRMVDADGRTYLDCFLCNGPLLLGHQSPVVMDAIRAAAPVGSMVVNPGLAVEAAEELQATVASAERVRFLNSGTEAVMAAVRVARAWTGKPNIVKFHGHYHGQDDQFLVGLGPTDLPYGSGVPPGTHANTLLTRYGDLPAIESLLGSRADIAAVVLDPAMHSGGLWGSNTDYLQGVRELTRKFGVVLIFDEVITGFRVAAGGAQALHGIRPDLTTHAKALAAGEKLSAVSGRAEILSCLDPERAATMPGAFQSGTGNDATAALAAAGAAMRRYRELEVDGGYARLASISAHLADGLRRAFARQGIPAHVNQLGPMLQLFLTDQPASFERCAGLPTEPLALFYLAMINEGVLLSLPTSNHIYLSFEHARQDIDLVVEKAEVVLQRHDFAALVSAADHPRGEAR